MFTEKDLIWSYVEGYKSAIIILQGVEKEINTESIGNRLSEKLKEKSGNLPEVDSRNAVLADGWREISKILPDKLTYCLVYNIISELGTGEIAWCFYNSEGKWAGENEFYNNVTHWQPLPLPPTVS